MPLSVLNDLAKAMKALDGKKKVHSPAAVTIPLQKHRKQPNNTKSNRTHKNTTKQKTRTKKAMRKVIGGPVQ